MYIKDLEILIPSLKKDLNKLIEQKQYILQDPEIQELSEDLDQLIGLYFKMLQYSY